MHIQHTTRVHKAMEMTENQPSQTDVSTNQLIQEMMKPMTALQEKIDVIQKNPSSRELHSRQKDSDDEMEDSSGWLVQVTETTKSFFGSSLLGNDVQ